MSLFLAMPILAATGLYNPQVTDNHLRRFTVRHLRHPQGRLVMHATLRGRKPTRPATDQRGLGDNSVTRYSILAPGDRSIGKLGRCRPGFSHPEVRVVFPPGDGARRRYRREGPICISH